MIEIGGLQSVSLVDYDGQVSTVIFLKGCNIRCPYCQNYKLLDPDYPTIDVESVLRNIKLNKVIDAVVISGGEPTIYGDELVEFIQEIKSLGLKVKLDTNGTSPDVLRKVLPLIDFIAMDIKTDEYYYRKVLGVDFDKIKACIRLILNAKDVGHEFRCTLVYPFVSGENIQYLKQLATIKWNEANLEDVLDPTFPMCALSLRDVLELKEFFENYVGSVEIKGYGVTEIYLPSYSHSS